jgi:hypothetical protein
LPDGQKPEPPKPISWNIYKIASKAVWLGEIDAPEEAATTGEKPLRTARAGENAGTFSPRILQCRNEEISRSLEGQAGFNLSAQSIKLRNTLRNPACLHREQ